MIATQKSLLLLLLTIIASPSALGFSITPSTIITAAPTTTTTPSRLYSELPSDSLGETERLLLDAKRSKQLGLEQRLGCTVKKDGLDGVRAVVWGVFHASNVIIPALGVALGLGIMLNMLGYGYYWDASGAFVIDSLEHIRYEQFFQMEAARLTATTVETVSETLGTMM